MMAFFWAAVLLLTLGSSHGKVYDRCELARELREVHRLPEDQIATWVCIAKHESDFNTSAVNIPSGDHGIFQISDVYCKRYMDSCRCSPPGVGLACNAPCSAFEDDDITDDVICIKRIYREHRGISGDGFNAWVVYPLYCKKDASRYIADCLDNEIDNNINYGEEKPSFNTTSPPVSEGDQEEYEFPPLPSPPKKALDTYQLFQGAPVLLSFPHLLYAHEEYHESVDGLHPDEKLHDTFVVLEPTSGAPLKAAKRVQFNMFIRAVPDILSIENVTNAVMPMFWIEESMTLSDDMINIINTTLLMNLKILEIVKWGLIGLGVTAIVSSLALIIYTI